MKCSKKRRKMIQNEIIMFVLSIDSIYMIILTVKNLMKNETIRSLCRPLVSNEWISSSLRACVESNDETIFHHLMFSFLHIEFSFNRVWFNYLWRTIFSRTKGRKSDRQFFSLVFDDWKIMQTKHAHTNEDDKKKSIINSFRAFCVPVRPSVCVCVRLCLTFAHSLAIIARQPHCDWITVTECWRRRQLVCTTNINETSRFSPLRTMANQRTINDRTRAEIEMVDDKNCFLFLFDFFPLRN